jgi:hypothetical protein
MNGEVRMKSRQFTGLLMLAAVLTVAAARLMGGQASSGAQQSSDAALKAYLEEFERTDAFCHFYEEQSKNNKPMPASNNFRVPGAGKGMFYVYSADEVPALIKHCDKFLELQRKLLAAMPRTP